MKNILGTIVTPVLSITLTNHLSELERLHHELWQFGVHHGLPTNVINSINLALEEIVTNVIEHGYDNQGEHSITIRCSVQDRQVISEVEDDAQPFNPLQAVAPDLSQPLENRPIGGLGIYLVRQIMDAVDYTYQDGKNWVRLKKRIVD